MLPRPPFELVGVDPWPPALPTLSLLEELLLLGGSIILIALALGTLNIIKKVINPNNRYLYFRRNIFLTISLFDKTRKPSVCGLQRVLYLVQ